MHRIWRAATAVSVMLVIAAMTEMTSPVWASPWLAQPDLSAAGANASVPDVAMSFRGDAIVTWQGSPAGGPVEVTQRPAGAGFSAPLQFGFASFDSLGTPQVAVGGDGDAVVVWQEADGSLKFSVWATFRPAGGSFGAPVRVSEPGATAVDPQVAMNAAGDTVVAWGSLQDGAVTVQAGVRPAGETFSAPADLSAPAGLRPMPRVAIDAAGNATVVWTQSDAAGTTVQAATRPDGGTFSAPATLSTTGPTSYASQQIATNPAGETVVAWSGSDGANSIVQAATRRAGGVFSAPANLSGAGRDADSPQVAIDAAGNASAVWARFDGTTRVVQFARRPAGEAFSAPVDISLAGGEARAPQIEVNAAGDAIVAWQRSNGTSTIIQATIRRAGTDFAPLTNLSAAGGDAVEPQVAIAADGDAIAAWQRSNGTHTIVQVAGYDGAGPQLRNLNIPLAVSAGQTATYSLSPLDVWSAVTATQWSFDDGTSATGAGVSHAFTTAGEHTVTVTATDALGNTTSATRTVTVGAPPTPPDSGSATPPAAPPAAPPPPALDPNPPPPTRAAAPSNRVSVIAATTRAGGLIGLTLRAPAAGAYRAVATSRRSNKRPLAYGRGRATAPRAGRVTLTIRPTLAAKRRLVARRARVAVAVTFKPINGTARTKRLSVVVKATSRR